MYRGGGSMLPSGATQPSNPHVYMSGISKEGRRHEFEGGGVNALEGGLVNIVKTLKFEKGGDV